MCRYLFFFALVVVVFISCDNGYTKIEKDKIDKMTFSELYKFKTPKNSFVFCLDTIKADEEYKKFSKYYCENGIGKQSYIYLSNYSVYIPVFVEYGCGTIGCYSMRNVLSLNVNKKKQWLVNKELVDNFNQIKMDSVMSSYFKRLKTEDRTRKSILKLNVKSVKNNLERDSLYISLITSYYTFIKREKMASNKLLDSLLIEYPFRLGFGNYNFLPPPPPPPIIGVIVD